MEKYVESLYNRLDKEGRVKLLVIMDNAIEEARKAVFCNFLPDSDEFRLIHHQDPNVRLEVKTSLAKQLGHSFIISATPVPRDENEIIYFTHVNYNAKFVNSICLCIQGGIEGLHSFNLSRTMKRKIRHYIVLVQNNGEDITPLQNLLAQLNDMYDDIEIECRSESLDAKLETVSMYEKYYIPLTQKMSGNARALQAFADVIKSAEKEVMQNAKLYKQCSGSELTQEEWETADEKKRFEYVIRLGNYGVLESKIKILNVDFSGRIPFCDALAIFIYAEFEHTDKSVIIDAGDDTDTEPLSNALRLVSECDRDCVYTIANPSLKTISGGEIKTEDEADGKGADGSRANRESDNRQQPLSVREAIQNLRQAQEKKRKIELRALSKKLLIGLLFLAFLILLFLIAKCG